MYNCSAADTAQPSQALQTGHPGTDPVTAHRRRSLMLDAYLDEVRAQLEPVVDQETDRHKWPHGAEKCEISELNDHFSNVLLDIIMRPESLGSCSSEESRLSRVVRNGIIARISLAAVAPPLLDLRLQPWECQLFNSTSDLARQSQGNDFVLQSIGIRCKRDLCPVLYTNDAVDHVLENRNHFTSKGNVEECGNEDREVIGNGSEYKDFLSQRHLVRIAGSVVLEFRHLFGDILEEAARVGKAYSKENSGKVLLTNVSGISANCRAGFAAYKVELVRSFVGLADERLDRKNNAD
jgi:hypothetical protein